MKTEKYPQFSRATRKKKTRSKLLKWSLISISILLIIAFSFTAYASWKVNEFMNKTSETSVKTPSENNPTTEQEPKIQNIEDQPFAMLLLGEDYRPETGSMNTDAIIVTIWNPLTKQVSLISIPRDTRADIPDFGEGKINSVYVRGEQEKKKQEKNGQTPTTSGPQMVMGVLSDMLGIPIKYYGKIDFKGFELIIDEIGGIKMDVERDMFYQSPADGTDINLKAGFQALNGKQALDYARFRKSSDGHDSNDFERNDRHQKIIKAFVDKLTTFKGITNVFDILDIAGDHIKTNLTPNDMKGLFWKYKGIKKSDVQSIKMQSYWKNPYVYVDDAELLKVKAELQKAFYGDVQASESHQ